jgi:hypothetical protein
MAEYILRTGQLAAKAHAGLAGTLQKAPLPATFGSQPKGSALLRLREYGPAVCKLAESNAICAEPECGREL